MSDLISRADAIEAVEKLKIVEDNKNYLDYIYNAGIEIAKKTLELMLSADAEEYIKECNTKTHDLVHRDVIKPKLVDCTDFVNWLLEEVIDEEMWELNAVANGEVIARKLKKLGLLKVKDGYYIRSSIEAAPPVLTCDGCRHVGTYDTDFPCSGCIRREKDYYEQER